MKAERTFTDDQITAILAGLIFSQRQANSLGGFGPDSDQRYAVERAQDIMNILRGRPTREQVWRAESAQWQREIVEREAELMRFLATGFMHSTAWAE